jgi:hypothetical protein
MHWYTLEGEPRHDRTLGQAKKEGLVPGATTVLDIIHRPGLEIWKQQQIVKAAGETMRGMVSSDQEYYKSVMDQAFFDTSARDEGSRVHGMIENKIKKDMPIRDYPGLDQWMDEHLGEGVSEQTVVCEKYGYAGTLDFIGQFRNSALESWEKALVDFKTQNVKSSARAYQSWGMQLAAYSFRDAHTHPAGLDIARKKKLISVVISTNADNPLVRHFSHWNQMHAWDGFKGALAAWRYENKYPWEKYASWGEKYVS